MLRFTLCFLTLNAISSLVVAGTEGADVIKPAEVRTAIARGLPFLETKGVAWLDNQKCIACHHGAWMVWGMNEARRAGVDVDPKKIDALSKRVAAMYMKDAPNYKSKKSGWVESTYMLLSQSPASASGKLANDKPAQWMAPAREILLAGQREDGSWKYAGQGLDRPDQENDEATTFLALAAMNYDANSTAADKAMDWLKNVKQSPGLDSLALRLWIETRNGKSDRATILKDELIARQNADGGWNWSAKRPTDAFATGESIYVLTLAGVKNDSPAIQKAWKFLLATQKPDGSWSCATRKPKGGSEIPTYWGSAWGIIGLSRSIEQVPETASANAGAK